MNNNNKTQMKATFYTDRRCGFHYKSGTPGFCFDIIQFAVRLGFFPMSKRGFIVNLTISL